MSEQRKKYKGYVGFRPRQANASPESEHVSGDMAEFVSDARQTKFRRSAVEIIEPNSYATNSGITANNVTKAHYLNPQKPIRRNQVSNNPSKEFYGKSGSATDYVNFQSEIRAFADQDPANYKALFARIDADGNGTLDKRELRAALQRQNASPYIIDTLMIHFDGNADGKVTWEEFRAGLDKAKAQLLRSVPFKKVAGLKQPSWELKKSKQVRC